MSRRAARQTARQHAAALPTEAIKLVRTDEAPEPREPEPHPLDVRVEPVIVAEPLIAEGSADEPVAVDEHAIHDQHEAELIDEAVEPGPAHTVLDDSADAADDHHHDAFAAAARAFSFTGEVPVSRAAARVAEGPMPAAAHVSRRRRSASLKRLTAASVSVGAMAIVGLLTVGLTTPVEAVAASTDTVPVSSELAGDVGGTAGDDVQAYVVPSTVTESALDRTESYSTGTMIDLAGTEGILNYSSQFFTNDITCPVQWPFATGTTVSYGFGMRSGTMHEGVDFTPGAGAHIQAVGDGVVSTSTDSGGSFGVTIVIDVVVDGEPFSIRYGHMQYGSRQVQVGDHVEVGEYLGRTGNTGRSYGAHTHVEVLRNGTTPIDPMPWFEQYATC